MRGARVGGRPEVPAEPAGSRGTGASAAPVRQARRLVGVRWLDVRLVGGVVLILVAVILGNAVLADRQAVATVWKVTKPLSAGSVVSSDALSPVQVPPGVASAYLSAESPPPSDRRLSRGIAAGELLPAESLVPAADLDLRRVVLAVPATTTVGLRTHRLVDIYVTPSRSSGASNAAGAAGDTPSASARLVLEHATVDEVAASSSFNSASTIGVAVLVPSDAVTAVLDAAATGAVVLVQRPDELAGEPQ